MTEISSNHPNFFQKALIERIAKDIEVRLGRMRSSPIAIALSLRAARLE